MPLNGQSSGLWTESSSALTIMYVGTKNSVNTLASDGFTQTNPPVVATAGTVSTNAQTRVFGILSGSVAFARPDQGENVVGGPIEGLGDPLRQFVKPLGLFLNNAAGYPFENQPTLASGVAVYASEGTFRSTLFETQVLAAVDGAAAGDTITYTAGMQLAASRNGYLQPMQGIVDGDLVDFQDNNNVLSELANSQGEVSRLGILKMAPDTEVPGIVFDLLV